MWDASGNMDVFQNKTDAAVPRLTEFTVPSNQPANCIAFTREWLTALRPIHLLIGCCAAFVLMLAMSGIDGLFGVNLNQVRPQLETGSVDFKTVSWIVCQLLMAHVILSLFGSLVCRDIAVRRSRSQGQSLLESVEFSKSRVTQFLMAPMIPGIACLLLAGCHWASRILAWVPIMGDTLHTLLATILSFFIAVLMLLTVVSWPLMLAAQCVEQSDCFDGLSRSFNLVLTEPVRFIVLLSTYLVVGAGPLIALNLLISTLAGPVATVFLAGLGIAGFFAWTTVAFLHLRLQIDAIESDEIYFSEPTVWAPVPLSGKVAHPIPER
jgi:hypothetical protein